MAERPQPGSPTTFDDPASLLEQDQILAEKCLHLQQQFSTQSLQLRGGGALPSALLYSMLLHAGYGNTAFGNGMAPYQPFYCPGQYIAPNPFAAAYNPNLWDSQELQGFGAENYFQNSPQESKPIITMAGMQPESDQRAQEPRPPAVDRKKNGYQANATKANRANTKEAAQIVQKRASAPPAVQRVANAHQNDTPTPKREDHTKNGAKWTTSRVVLTSESRTTDLKGISMPKPIAFGKWVPGYWVYLEEMQKVGEIMNATGLLVNSVAYILPAKATVDLNSGK